MASRQHAQGAHGHHREAAILNAVLRAVSSSALALLLVVTLMWGGCISCPQFFMFPGKANGTKSCCNAAGKCTRTPAKTPVRQECQKMPMEAHASGHLSTEPPAADGLWTIVRITQPYSGTLRAHQRELAIEYAPPDRQALHSTFLI